MHCASFLVLRTDSKGFQHCPCNTVCEASMVWNCIISSRNTCSLQLLCLSRGLTPLLYQDVFRQMQHPRLQHSILCPVAYYATHCMPCKAKSTHQCRCLTRHDHLVIPAACLDHLAYDLCMFCSVILVMREVHFSASKLILGLLPFGCTRPSCSPSCVAVKIWRF